MDKLNLASDSLSETLKKSELQNVTINLVETLTDSFLENGIVKDIPILGTFLGLTKTAINLNDRLFLKKIISFLIEIKDIQPVERQKLIEKIDNSSKFKIKVGEKLLYIINKCDDHISSKYISKIFKSFLEKKIEYSDFLRASSIIQNILFIDLEYFIKVEEHKLIKNMSEYATISEIENNLINSGLCSLRPSKYLIKRRSTVLDERSGNGQTLKFMTTEIGELIRDTLK